MIDTHAHIDGNDYIEDLNEVCEDAFSNGLEAIIIPGIEPKDFKRIINISLMYQNIYAGIGIHPHNANEASKENFDLMEEYVNKYDKIVAIGETGLDYFYNFSTPEQQRASFIRHIEIAKKYDLPLIIHNRDSDDDMLNILKMHSKERIKGVMHCFSSNFNYLQDILKMDLYVSFTGNITYKKTDLVEVVRETPLDRIMLETDSPYMAPVPYRGKRNKPSYVKYVAEKIAEIKSISIEEVIKMTTENAKRLFKIAIAVLIFLTANIAYSQENMANEEFDNSDTTAHYNPYKKGFGFGGIIATNTIVQTFYPEEEEHSADGIFSFGGNASYYLTDFLSLEASYVYSKDTKMVKYYDTVVRDPNYHHVVEITTKFYATPWQKLNFYAMIGGQVLYNRYSITIGKYDDFLKYGMNTGIGILGNIDMKNAGKMTLAAEWKVDFIFGKSELTHDYRWSKDDPKYNKPVEVSWFYSIPRFIISWYPNFKK